MFDLTRYLCDVVYNSKIFVAGLFTAACCLWTLRRFCIGGVCRCKVQLHGKTVLITGANTGIGKETARDLARRGARVLLACRDNDKANKTAEEIRQITNNKNVAVYLLDLASLKSVRQCASDVIANEPRLDILINNAGIMWTPEWKTVDGFEKQFGVNHLGHFLFTNLLLDLLKKSAPSRIINVSSLAHISGKIHFENIVLENIYSPLTAYRQSKLAHVLFSRELSKRLKGSIVTANSLHPGIINTELLRYMGQGFGFLGYFLYYGFWWVRYIIKTPVEGAQTTIHCAVAPELEVVTGKYFSDCVVKEEAPQAKDDMTAARLWEISEEMTGLKQSS